MNDRKKASGWLLKSSPLFFFFIVFMTYGGARHGVPWRGLVVMLIVHALYISLIPEKGRRLLLMLSAGVIGFLLDSMMGVAGVYVVAEPGRWLVPAPLCPEWILVLWLNFGFFLYGYVMQMYGRLKYTTLLGLVFALLIYSNATRMGTIVLRSPALLSIAIGAVAWALIVPCLYWIGQKITMFGVAESSTTEEILQ